MLRVLRPSSAAEFLKELEKIEVDHRCLDIFTEKSDSFILKITDLSTPGANILKQTAISFGADLAVHREVITGKIQRSDAIFTGTRRQLRRTVQALSGQPFGLEKVRADVQQLLANLDNPPASLDLPAGSLSFDVPRIMGVLNLTPDSFYDGGKYLEPSRALARIEEMVAQGADIIDVGAESSRPGAEPVSADEQLRRLEPVFSSLEKSDLIWSIDATNPRVAQAALDKGASVINDISGGSDETLWGMAASYNAAYVLMHIQGTPRNMQENPAYQDFNAELYSFFSRKLAAIEETGVKRNRLIIDPGIGFGKRLEDNTAAIRRLWELRSFGVPLLVGPSRKSFLGRLLGLGAEDRLEASLAAAVLAYSEGAHILRMHDVAEARRALDTAAGIRSVNGVVAHG